MGRIYVSLKASCSGNDYNEMKNLRPGLLLPARILSMQTGIEVKQLRETLLRRIWPPYSGNKDNITLAKKCSLMHCSGKSDIK